MLFCEKTDYEEDILISKLFTQIIMTLHEKYLHTHTKKISYFLLIACFVLPYSHEEFSYNLVAEDTMSPLRFPSYKYNCLCIIFIVMY